MEANTSFLVCVCVCVNWSVWDRNQPIGDTKTELDYKYIWHQKLNSTPLDVKYSFKKLPMYYEVWGKQMCHKWVVPLCVMSNCYFLYTDRLLCSPYVRLSPQWHCSNFGKQSQQLLDLTEWAFFFFFLSMTWMIIYYLQSHCTIMCRYIREISIAACLPTPSCMLWWVLMKTEPVAKGVRNRAS